MSLSILSRWLFIIVAGSRSYNWSSGRFQNVFDATDGDDDPVGAVVELVTDFVDGFIEEVSFEKNLEVLGIGRDEDGVRRCLQIILEKGAAHVAIPEVGPAFEKRHIFGAHPRLPERAVSRVLKRAHHAGDVAQGRALQFALAYRPRRFALEIENDKIFSGRKHL